MTTDNIVQEKPLIPWEGDLELKFGTWAKVIKPFWAKGGFDKIYSYLKERSKQGHKITPLSSDVFKVFELTDYQSVKCFIFGMSPYHSLNYKSKQVIADGLLMGCSKNDQKLQPSLEQFYNELFRVYEVEEDDYHVKPADVSYLSSEGVFMGNISYTTEIGKAGKNIDIWSEFTQFFLEEVVALTGCPCIFLGKDAGKFAKFLPPFNNWVFEVSHPASASYSGSEWSSEGVFQKVDKIIMDSNKEKINWILELPF